MKENLYEMLMIKVIIIITILFLFKKIKESL
jgi:hypothetical protein